MFINKIIKSVFKVKTIDSIMLITIILLSFLLNIYKLDDRSIWLDEGFSIYYANRIFTEFNNVIINDSNMIFYYFVLHYWLLLNSSEFFIRLLSVLFATLTLPIVYLIALKLFNNKIAILATLILSINVIFITYAQEARSYSFLLFFSAFSNFLFLNLIDKKIRIKHLFSYSTVNIMLIYSHFFGLWVIFAQLFYGLLFYKKKFKLLLYIFILSSCTFLPLLFISAQEARLEWIEKPNFRKLFDIYYYLFGGKNIIYLFFLSGILFFYNEIKNKFLILNTKKKELVFLILQFVLPIIFAFLVSYIYTPLYIYRYLISVLIPLSILFSFMLIQIKGKFLKFSLFYALFIFSWIAIDIHFQNYESENWKKASSYLKSNFNNSDYMILYIADLYFPLHYYLKNINEYNYIQINKKDIVTFSELPKNNIWLVLSHTGDSSISKDQLFNLKNKFNKNYKLVINQNFEGITIHYYRFIISN